MHGGATPCTAEPACEHLTFRRRIGGSVGRHVVRPGRCGTLWTDLRRRCVVAAPTWTLTTPTIGILKGFEGAPPAMRGDRVRACFSRLLDTMCAPEQP
jgi:hypothetical protein